jgi:hypothetical protein
MKKTKNKILTFPPPKEPTGQTIICQIGSERFAIHMEVEDLPPPEPVIPFGSPPRKQEHPLTQPRFSNPSSTTDLHSRADGVIHVMNAVTAAKKDTFHMTTLIPEEQTKKTPATPNNKAGVGKRRARVAPSKAKTGRKALRPKKAATARHGSKTANVLDLLQRPGGVTLKELIKATGWQAHSVRGFISGTVGKKMGISIESSARTDGERVYCSK